MIPYIHIIIESTRWERRGSVCRQNLRRRRHAKFRVRRRRLQLRQRRRRRRWRGCRPRQYWIWGLKCFFYNTHPDFIHMMTYNHLLHKMQSKKKKKNMTCSWKRVKNIVKLVIMFKMLLIVPTSCSLCVEICATICTAKVLPNSCT